MNKNKFNNFSNSILKEPQLNCGKLFNSKWNKKGMFFIILALILITFFILSYTFFSVVKNRSSIEKRIETLNGFVFAVEEDLERRLYISSFRILFLFEDEIVDSGEYLNDTDVLFDELFFNGTINGEPHPDVMTGATFSDIEEILREKASKMGANLSFSNPVLSIQQEDPWNVKVILTMDVFTEDLSDLVKWNRTLVTEALVPIDGFGDPVYYVSTNYLMFNNISMTPYTDFVSGNDVSNLLSHTIDSYYIASSTAPSFLKRLEGDFSSDPNGIESLVNLDKLASLGISTQQKSVVDYIYFSSSNPSSCKVSPAGMPFWFRLDSNHTTTYEVSWNCV